MDDAAATFTAAESIFTLPLLMIIPASPSPRYCPPLPPQPPLRSCAPPLLTTPPWASPFVAYSLTMATAIVPVAFCVVVIELGAPSLHPSLHSLAPTEKPNALSKPLSANGLTPALTRDSQQRLDHLLPWLHYYNWHRPHGSLNHAPPISRSGLDRKISEIPHLAHDQSG
jgi:hypothetical protein